MHVSATNNMRTEGSICGRFMARLKNDSKITLNAFLENTNKLHPVCGQRARIGAGTLCLLMAKLVFRCVLLTRS